jgi:anti-anti-sigma regulatory factor
MEQPSDKLQILYEIALNVGERADPETTAQATLRVLLRRLNCSAGSVLGLVSDEDGGDRLEPLVVIPRNVRRDALYTEAFDMALSVDLAPIAKGELSGLFDGGGNSGAGFFYLLALPQFGVLLLVKRGQALPLELLKDLQPVCAKFASACTACIARRQLRDQEARLSEALARAEEANQVQSQHLATIAEQHAVIRKLSTPVLQVWDRILAVPLIGAFDRERAQQFNTSLLAAVKAHRAEFAIIDVTGLVFDDDMAPRHIQTAVRGCQLLGARCIVTGMTPAVAQSLVRANIALGVETTGNLQAGLQKALSRLRATP